LFPFVRGGLDKKSKNWASSFTNICLNLPSNISEKDFRSALQKNYGIVFCCVPNPIHEHNFIIEKYPGWIPIPKVGSLVRDQIGKNEIKSDLLKQLIGYLLLSNARLGSRNSYLKNKSNMQLWISCSVPLETERMKSSLTY
jgi:hypothetical protein